MFGSSAAEVTAAEVRPAAWPDAARTWIRIGLESFGGPAGQIGVIHREVVARHRWIDDATFARALQFCMLLPGPEAQQLATYLGWRLHGVRGGLFAGIAFVLPGALLMLVLAGVYTRFGAVPAIGHALLGVKAVVVAMVALAVVRLGTRLVRTPRAVTAATLAFTAVYALHVPVLALVAAALALGALWPEPATAAAPPPPPATPPPSLARTLRTAAWWAALWWAPIGALALLGLGDTLYVAQGVSHGAVAALSFGGAYAALAWASQGALAHGWVTSGHVVDSMGLAESTPGPLILVLPLLAFIGAHHAPAGLPPLLGGVLAATLSLWMIFVPSFMWIFAGAPWIEALARCARIASATRLVGAVAVGLVAALALGVAMHTWFGATTRWDVGDHVRVEAPTWPTVRAPLIALSLAALVALQRKVSVGVVLLAGAGLTLALGALAPARLS